ncbi:uncharacterized protein N7511_008893 [Penicillium nucicola]|uniref:uncharacterized protein n=1 Tax=Penicillium nucicola TaxID=1850975 RepID=UPI0025458235|nr:uncharacterized protein N7511_008893 [Penicillium nucicola]KAJ5747197.1 hypothetical protein N7511_008893 [Penicillium nucicola]
MYAQGLPPYLWEGFPSESVPVALHAALRARDMRAMPYGLGEGCPTEAGVAWIEFPTSPSVQHLGHEARGVHLGRPRRMDGDSYMPSAFRVLASDGTINPCASTFPHDHIPFAEFRMARGGLPLTCMEAREKHTLPARD